MSSVALEGLAPYSMLAAVASAARRARDKGRAALARALQQMIEDEIVGALRRVGPDEAVEAAEAAWRRNSLAWSLAFRLVMRLAEDLSVVGSNVPEGLTSHIRQLAEGAPKLLPKLPPGARRHLRATLLFILSLERETSLLAGRSLAELEAAQKVPKTEAAALRLSALLQALLVLGERGGVPAETVDALALALWQMVREGAPEDAVEDAYLSAVAMEAKEHREPVVPFRPSSGQPKSSRRKAASGS